MANKYNYITVIQGSFGYGWEDLSEYDRDDWRNVQADLKEYRYSNTGSYRRVNRRELAKEYVNYS